MNNSLSNDENSILGKKRQQQQSPFSAATPKSRLGKEPKRLFGPSPLALNNAADPNLDQTALDSDASYVSDCVDPNLEETALIGETSSCSSKDLSMVSEEDADVTLADTFEEKVTIDVEKTPTKSPEATIDLCTSSSAVSAPPEIQKGLVQSPWAEDLFSSPVYHSKPQIDVSLHEFAMLEQQVDHEYDVRELTEKVAQLEAHIKEINEARLFEEKTLMQQTDSVTKKAKADKAAAQAEIQELRAKLEEAANGQDAEKEQLREQLVQLHGQVEELTEKALKMEEKQVDLDSYEHRMELVEKERIEALKALEQAEARIAALGTEIEEQKVEAEETRKMMVEAMTALEQEVADKKKDGADKVQEELEAKIRELETQLEEAKKLGDEQKQCEAKVEELQKAAEEKQKEVEALKEEITLISSSSSTNEELIAEHNQELDDLRKLMVSEVAAVEAQLEAAHLKAAEASNTEDLQKIIEELTEAQKTSEAKILELSAVADESKKSLEASEAKIQELTASIEEVQKVSDAKILELTAAAETSEAKIQEAQKSSEASEVKILELTTALKTSDARIQELTTAADENQKTIAEASEAKIHELTASLEEAQKTSETLNAEIQEVKAALETSEARLLEVTAVADEHLKATTEASEAKIQELRAAVDETKKTSEAKILELSAAADEFEKSQEASEAKIQELTASIEEVQKASDAKILEVTAVAEAFKTKMHEAQKSSDDADALIRELTTALGSATARIDRLTIDGEEVAKAILEESEAKYKEFTSFVDEALNESDAKLKKLKTAFIEADKTAKLKAITYAARMEALEAELLHTRQESADLQKAMELKYEQEIFDQANAIENLRMELDVAQQNQPNGSNEPVEPLVDEQLLDSIRDELHKAEDAVKRLEAELEAVKAEADEKIGEVRKNVEETAEQEKQLMQKEFEELKAASEAKILEMEETLKAHEQSSDASAATEEKIRVLGATIQQQTAEIDQLRNEAFAARKTYDRQIQELQHAYSDEKYDKDLAKEELEKLRADAKEETGSLRDIRDALDNKLKEAEATFAYESDKYQQELAARDVLIAELQKELDALGHEDGRLEALNGRCVVLETSMESARKELEAMDERRAATEQQLVEARAMAQKLETELRENGALEEAHKEKAAVIEEAQKKIGEIQEELRSKIAAIEEARLLIAEYQEKLEVAEAALAQKETSIVTLESRIDSMSQQFEQQLTEATAWKTQAMSMDSLSGTVAQMSEQLKDLSARLEASNRRVHEVEETAQHDVTVMQEEVDGRMAELEQAKVKIGELEADLAKAKAEIKRLEDVCDEFDEDEAKLKNQIDKLETEIKKMKGEDKPAAPVMGLLQQARMGIKPLSRESSQIETSDKDQFEDASDSFVVQNPAATTMLVNETARPCDSPNVTSGAKSTTILHPDDSAAETPSKKKANQSKCNHQ